MDKQLETDIELFGDIFRRHAPAVYSYILKLTSNTTDAEEVTQETFLKVWENRRTLDGVQNMQVYVNTIARNIIYNMFRRAVVKQQYGEYLKASPEYTSLEKEVHLGDLKKSLNEGISKLPTQQREILMLKTKGFSNDEIAQLLDISKRTVEAHLNKAYKTLRAGFGDIDKFLPLITMIVSGM